MTTHKTQLDPRLQPGAKEQQVSGSPTCSSVPAGAHDAQEATAYRMAAVGLPVFLLGRSKSPVARCPACRTAPPDHDREACPCLLCHGFYAATTDPNRIREMFRRVPGGMLAMRTGAESGIVVVDIDPGHGGAVLPEIMPPTAYVVTGSGGLHLWYRHPATRVPCSQSRVGPGIDIRGEGGYVVVPPAIHPRTGLPYRWAGNGPVAEMAPGLLAACQPPRPTPSVATAPRATPTTRRAGGITDPNALLAAHLEAVRKAPEGRRRNTLYGAARGVARMVSAGAIKASDAALALTEVGREAGQEDRKIQAAIEGGFRAEGVPL